MNETQNSDRELIYKFFSNTLTKEEKKEFALKQQNSKFSDLLAEIIIQHKGRIDLKDKLKTISLQQHKKTDVRKKIIRLSLASSTIAAIIIIGFFYFNTVDNSDLFNDNFKPFPNVYSVKGVGDVQSSTLKEAMRLYDEEAYHAAVLKFEELDENELKAYTRLYYSISLLATNEIKKSKQSLYKINSNTPAYVEAQWYLGLAYLKQDSTKKAISTLKKVQHQFGKNKQIQIDNLIEQIK